jgi:Fe-S cluster assembly protein SufD
MNNVGTALYEEMIRAFSGSTHTKETASLAHLRKEAFQQFKEKGFPTIKDEDWRFTNMAPFLKEAYQVNVPVTVTPGELETLLDSTAVEGWDAWKLVLVNGQIDLSLSDIPSDGPLKISPLREILGSEAQGKFIGAHQNTDANRFAALNTALFQDGLFIEVTPGQKPEKPLHIVHLYTADVPSFVQPRHLVLLHRLSELTFMESTACVGGEAPVLVNSVLECDLAEGSSLTHYVLQRGRKGERMVQHTQVYQARDSRYDNVTVSLPETDLIRNQLQVALDGAGSECHLYGLYLPSAGQLIDNHTVVDHRQPHCESNELYKGVLQNSAKAVFNGKIFVRQIAQKTNAFQQNNNLLLGDKALVHSKPQLEIFADDVKCSHGSTIGQFNPESLFYLRARGIGEALAKELLVQAFGADITDRVSSDAVSSHLEKHLLERPVTLSEDVPHIEHI